MSQVAGRSQAVAGGLVVVAFSLIDQAGHPKRFAGLFFAAPQVALASLTVTVIAAWLAWLVVAGGLYLVVGLFLFRASGLFLKQDQLLSKPR